MIAPKPLPLPHLDARPCGARRICMLTDDALFGACGVRVAFTGRDGGQSSGAFSSLNLGSHVGDDPTVVQENRRIALDALGAADAACIVPNQVHGSEVVSIDDAGDDALAAAQEQAGRGADALAVSVPQVAALLCFADCTPVILVSPSGSFAVAHAGWRGVVAHVAVRALEKLAELDGASEVRGFASRCNAYIGPHIRSECFEVGADVADVFCGEFGESCIEGERHVSMAQALRVSLQRAGMSQERICDAGLCTKCNPDAYYSYRASGGRCGRHGAIAFRRA